MVVRSPKGCVAVTVFRGRLRLRFRADGQRYTLSLGWPDTPEYRKLANAKAQQIQSDIGLARFDVSLQRYKAGSSQTPEVLTLVKLWEDYTAARQKLVQETTLRVQYRNVARHLAKLPHDLQVPDRAVGVRDFFLKLTTPNATLRTLTQLSACCDWAIDAGVIDDNPFRGVVRKFRKSVKHVRQEIDPFSKDEMLAIIAAFESDPVFGYYTPLVKFLFWTGCRTGEAIGLKWGHVSPNGEEINFCESVSTQLKIRKVTKTGKARSFPCNEQLRTLLLSIKPDDVALSMPVFLGKRGKEVNCRAFVQNAWKGGRTLRDGRVSEGIVTRLVSEGKVKRYRTQYNTRHTFITLSLEAGVPPVQVARWVGNSVETIMRHYMGLTVKVSVPLFQA